MNKSRLSTTTAAAAVLILAGSAVALAAGDPTPTAPPRIAVVARGDGTSFADALAVGSVAGQLGAPVFTTPATTLADATATALTDYAPELVIITGGTAAISAEVEAAIESATGLPDDQVVRAAGADRYETAAAIAEILEEHDAAFLPVGATATDADLLDGMDSSEFAPAQRPADHDQLVPLSDPAGASAASVGEATVTLDDRCPGTDHWTIRATANGYWIPSTAAEGNASISLGLDFEAGDGHNTDNQVTDEIGPSAANHNWTVFSNTWLFEDLDAGSHAVHALASETTDGTAPINNGRLIVEVVGFHC